MKKKLLFVIPEYSHGGTNKSLENLLHFIDKEKYKVSIYSLYEDGGDYYKKIFAPYILKKSLLYHLAHDNKVTRKVMGALMKVTSKINFDWLYRYEVNRLQREYMYDSVIAYQEGGASEFVSVVKGSVRKISWMHGCYNEGVGHSREQHDRDMYSKFDSIVSVSEASNESFLKIFPEFRGKCTYVYNFIDVDSVIQQAGDRADVVFDENKFNILSVGRFTRMKNFYRIPEWAATIRQYTDKPFCWYVIGEGEDYADTLIKIHEYGVENCVKLLGARNNPYPYFKNADLHVCASDFESFSYTIAESKALHTPVLCNVFSVAQEVVNKDVGIIENINKFPEVIVDLLEDKNNRYTILKETIKYSEVNNLQMLDKLNRIL